MVEKPIGRKIMSALFYERLLSNVYRRDFWEKTSKYAKYDFKQNKMRDYLLNNKPDPNVILISGMDENEGNGNFEPSEAPHLLDLPFSTCVVEATDRTLFNIDSRDIPGGTTDMQAMFIVEMDDQYGFVGISIAGDYTWAVDPNQDQYKLMMTVSQRMCGFINSKKTVVGQTKTNFRLKHKKTGIYKLKKLIHISDKVSGIPVEKRFFNVDWSHKWEVRGHRRSIGLGKVGKNRNGDYVWKDYTWVKSHVKGPDDKGLVKKVRMVS